MRSGKRKTLAGLCVLALLAVNSARAEEPVSPKGDPPPPPPPQIPNDEGGGHPRDPVPAPPEGEGLTSGGFFFTGDYLLVRPRRNALDFAISSPNLINSPGGSVESLFWETRNAFRFGGGYELPGSAWEARVNYTYLYSQGQRSLSSPDGGTLFATLSHAGFFDDVASASGFTSINFNVIDLEAARRVVTNDALDLSVFGGGRFAWIDQQFTATYNGGSGGATNAVVDSPVYFRGFGLTAGGEAVWKLGHEGTALHNFGLYGRARGSILSGEFRNFLTETNNNGAVALVSVREKYQQLVPVMELGLGVAWQGEHWRFRAGYELSNWFNMVNSLDFISSTSLGKPGRRASDLTLEGLAVELGLVF